MLLNLLKPDGYREETLPVREVEDDDNAVGALVVRIRDSSVALLPRRVPNLQLYRRLVDLHGSEPEINSDRANVVLLETIILFQNMVMDSQWTGEEGASGQKADLCLPV